jgi:hypothetical protein
LQFRPASARAPLKFTLICGFFFFALAPNELVRVGTGSELVGYRFGRRSAARGPWQTGGAMASIQNHINTIMLTNCAQINVQS